MTRRIVSARKTSRGDSLPRSARSGRQVRGLPGPPRFSSAETFFRRKNRAFRRGKEVFHDVCLTESLPGIKIDFISSGHCPSDPEHPLVFPSFDTRTGRPRQRGGRFFHVFFGVFSTAFFTGFFRDFFRGFFRVFSILFLRFFPRLFHCLFQRFPTPPVRLSRCPPLSHRERDSFRPRVEKSVRIHPLPPCQRRYFRI